MLFALSHIESLSLWLLSFIFLGWEVNCSGPVNAHNLHRVNLARWSKEILPNQKTRTFRKRSWILLGGVYKLLIGALSLCIIQVHTYRNRHHIFDFSIKKKIFTIVKKLWMWMYYIIHSILSACPRIAICIKGSSLVLLVVVSATHAWCHNFLFAHIYTQFSSQISASRLNRKSLSFVSSAYRVSSLRLF